MPEPHDVVIIGPGAIGLALARYLNKDGKSVGVIGRKKWVDVLGDKGIEFIRFKGESLEEKDHCYPNERFEFYSDDSNNLEDLKSRGLKDDGLIILASKTPNLEEIVGLAESVINPKGKQKVLMIQNGIRPELRVQRRLKEKYDGISERLVSGIVMASMAITDFKTPTIKYGIANICLGSWEDFDIRKDSILTVENLLKRAAYGRAEVAVAADQDDYRMKRFEKAALNGANVLSAIFDAKVGDLFDNTLTNQTMRQKLEESVIVANSEGININIESLRKKAAYTYDNVVRKHFASMAQDLQVVRNNPERLLITEIGDLDLSFAEIGKSHGVETPFNLFYGGIMEDFTLAYNMLKCTNPEKAEEFAKEFIATNRKSAGFDSTTGRTTVEKLTRKLEGKLQELKGIYLEISSKPINYSYTLSNITEKEILNILVVDDEQGLAKIHAKHLESMLKENNELTSVYDIMIKPAYSAQEAIDMAKENHIAVVIADEVMPGKKGHEMKPYFSPSTALIIYSARASETDRKEIRRSGCQEYISKQYHGIEEIADAALVGIKYYEEMKTKELMI